MNPKFRLLLTFLFSLSLISRGQVSDDLRARGEASLKRGAEWLLTQQNEQGFFGIPDSPAMTGLAVIAFSSDPARRASPEFKRAVDWIASTARPDGGLYVPVTGNRRGGGLPVYNTGICMLALHLSGQEAVRPLVLNARKFMAAGQRLEGDSATTGGFGYDAGGGSGYADMSNTYVALQGMALTREAEDLREGGRVELDKAAAARFVSRMQHRRESNPADWVMDDDANRGGFTYQVPEKDGSLEEQGSVKLAAYGAMTYAGMLSLIYAEVDRQDPRIKSAQEWASRHWTVDENPGVGTQGYYYFLNILAKCMDTLGGDFLRREDGSPVNWREELVSRLLELQREDGSWKNDDNRYWEGNPVLVTAYTLSALRLALGE